MRHQVAVAIAEIGGLLFVAGVWFHELAERISPGSAYVEWTEVE